MPNVRACLFLLFILLVDYQLVTCKPTFGMLCNIFCDDDDSSDDSDDYSFMDIFDPCSACSSKESETATTTASPNDKPVNIIIPPSNGLNITVSSSPGGWLFNLLPWLGGAATTAAPPAATTAAPAATTAKGGTEATTAAATTAKA